MSTSGYPNGTSRVVWNKVRPGRAFAASVRNSLAPPLIAIYWLVKTTICKPTANSAPLRVVRYAVGRRDPCGPGPGARRRMQCRFLGLQNYNPGAGLHTSDNCATHPQQFERTLCIAAPHRHARPRARRGGVCASGNVPSVWMRGDSLVPQLLSADTQLQPWSLSRSPDLSSLGERFGLPCRSANLQ